MLIDNRRDQVSARPLNEDLGNSQRQLPIGGEMGSKGGVHFRVWAPERRHVSLVLESGPGSPGRISLEPDPQQHGYHAVLSTEASAGALYRYQLDDDPMHYPDPASRFQPDGPHGPSQVIDSHAFPWTDQHWRGATREGQIIYEMHVGTFTDRKSTRLNS